MFKISKMSRVFRNVTSVSRLRQFSAQSSSPQTIGFIGLGNMGSRMADNLMKRGHALVVFDKAPPAIERFKKLGAETVQNPSEVAKRTDKIVTMLPSSPHVREVYLGTDGIIQTCQSGSLLIDASTIDPSVSREVALAMGRKNAVYLDAPVSGGVVAAAEARLTFMVGGPAHEYDAAVPILEAMGKTHFHCGKVGNGQAAKITNNMLLAISMIATAEAMSLGQRLGLDPKLLAKIINTSSGRCWSSEVYNPVPGIVEGIPSCRQYEGGFSATLMTKDLGLAQEAAASTQTPTPLGGSALQLYRLLLQRGYGDKDFSVIYEFLQKPDAVRN